MNEKVYIHELIDIIGANRARYMHHMTANWSPIGQEERGQRCFGVWGTVGSTGRWPEVVNLWEHDGWDGLAASFRHELTGAGLQDPKLAKWWEEAASFRRGGIDRLVVPAPWTRTIEELCEDGVRGDVYAHETYTVPPGTARDVLERMQDASHREIGHHGWELVGAFETTARHETEAIVIWAVPTWDDWVAYEEAERTESALRRWRRALAERVTGYERFLMCDAPLSPMRTGRQPQREDRLDDWADL